MCVFEEFYFPDYFNTYITSGTSDKPNKSIWSFEKCVLNKFSKEIVRLADNGLKQLGGKSMTSLFAHYINWIKYLALSYPDSYFKGKESGIESTVIPITSNRWDFDTLSFDMYPTIMQKEQDSKPVKYERNTVLDVYLLLDSMPDV
jgi:hypothetical protein